MKSVLIVDDAVFMRRMLTDIIEKHDYKVIGEAGNGKEAEEKYKELKPDIVTMDITMPDVDGLAGLKLIKAFDPEANVIMCSAMGQQALVIEAIQGGALDFIVKPFQAERVLDALAKVK